MLYWSLFIRLAIQWRTTCCTWGQILAPGRAGTWSYEEIAACDFLVLLLICLLPSDMLALWTLRRKGYGPKHKERTNYFGNKMAFPPNYLAPEGQTGSREGVGAQSDLRSGAAGSDRW